MWLKNKQKIHDVVNSNTRLIPNESNDKAYFNWLVPLSAIALKTKTLYFA